MINVKPNIHIRRLSFMFISMVIKNNNTHIAQGLKPSTKPITIDIIGNRISEKNLKNSDYILILLLDVIFLFFSLHFLTFLPSIIELTTSQ